MSKKEIVVLVLRISSLALVFYTLNQSVPTLEVWKESVGFNLSSSLLMVFGPIILAIFTWVFAFQLAHVFLPTITEEKDEPKLNLERQQIEETLFTVIGVFVLTYAIPDAFYWLSFWYRSSSLNIDMNLLSPEFVAPIFTTGIELVIGFWLLFGAKGLGDFLKKVRAAGQNKRSAF